MLPPSNMPLRRLSQEEGISHATLAKWRAEARTKGQLLPDAKSGPEGWSSRDKLAAVIGEPLCRHRFETNGERADECGRSWPILSAPGCLPRAAELWLNLVFEWFEGWRRIRLNCCCETACLPKEIHPPGND